MAAPRLRKTIVVLCLVWPALLLLPFGVFAARAQDGAPVTIMTQNMDAGSDLGFVVALGVPEGVDLTLAEIQASHIPERAELLGKRIAAERPDAVALEEVTLWRTGPTPETATQVVYDQLGLLRSALARHGVPYEVVAVNTLTDLALPGKSGALRYTDRDALLVRSDLRPPFFHFSGVRVHRYQATLRFRGLPVYQGWISADVHTEGREFRLVMTHLMTPIPGDPEATRVQVAQARELIHALRHLKIPVVVCGDFNSDANFGDGPDATSSASLMEAAGYTDVWKIANPGKPGDTWPLFLEDRSPTDFFPPSSPFERIDLFFSRGLRVLSARKVLSPAPAGTRPSYGSDHAGVMATFRP